MAKREMKTKKVDENVTNVVVETTVTVEDGINEPVFGAVSECMKLNIRKKPNTKSDVLGVLNKNEKVEIDMTYENKDWYKLTSGGYCMKKYITIK